MGQAREIMDKITDAVMAADVAALGRLYAEDATAETPDEGTLEGRDEVVRYLMTFARAFPDVSFDMIAQSETDTLAIDEAYLVATHSGPLATPDGELPPTGKPVRVRECDILTVRDGLATSHRFYYDQLDFLSQLGVLQPSTIVMPDARPASLDAGAAARP